jgi:PAS domain S-box-containing protein
LDAVEQAVIVTDMDGHIVYWNPFAEQLYGWSSEEAMGRRTIELFASEQAQERVAKLMAYLQAGNSWSGEYLARRRDGQLLPTEVSMAPMFDVNGQPTHIIGVSFDITERKQAEEALQESEQKYRDLVEKVSDVIYSVDTVGAITYLNPAIETLIGLPPEQVLGQPFDQFIHPEDLGRLQENVQVLFSGVIPDSAEYRVLSTSGEVRWIHVTSQPVVDRDQVTGIQGVLTDITERKRVEAQLEEAAKAAERERLARELHDSVTQVLFSATLLAEILPQIWLRDPEKALQRLDKLRRYTRGALAEMRTMLLELRPSAIINTPLGELLGQLTEAVTGRTGLPFQLSIEQIPSLPEDVQTNFYRIAQEALNNVVKHAQANLVSVSLNATLLTPDSTGASGYRVRLVIQDDGVGFIPGEIQSGRMGIGIMHERAAGMQATLSLESQPEHGTRVTLIWCNEWRNPS